MQKPIGPIQAPQNQSQLQLNGQTNSQYDDQHPRIHMQKPAQTLCHTNLNPHANWTPSMRLLGDCMPSKQHAERFLRPVLRLCSCDEPSRQRFNSDVMPV